MSSLTSRMRTTSEGHEGMNKYPIKRLEISIKNFIKVLSIALERLHKHSVNIKRLTAMEDWPELHKEQVNATRTVQQITSNIKEIEKVRCQVSDEDLPQFDSRISGVKTEAVAALDEFLELLGGDAAAELGVSQKSSGPSFECGKGDLDGPVTEDAHLASSSPMAAAAPSTHQDTDGAFTVDSTTSTDNMTAPGTSSSHRHSASGAYDYNEDDVDHAFGLEEADTATVTAVHTPLLVTSNLHSIPHNSEASASLEQLRENIEDLNELVHDFADNVEQQGETINCIEDNIDSAHANVSQGTSHLATASKYKAAMFPAVGAVLGGVLGGPIGFVAGMKIGGLAAVTGGAVGFAGGRYVKKRQEKIVEMEMSKMSYNMPLPDIQGERTTHTTTASSSSSSSSSNPTTAATTTTDAANADRDNEEEGEVSVEGFINVVKGWWGNGKEQ